MTKRYGATVPDDVHSNLPDMWWLVNFLPSILTLETASQRKGSDSLPHYRLAEAGHTFLPLRGGFSVPLHSLPYQDINGSLSGHRPLLLLSHSDQPSWMENLLRAPHCQLQMCWWPQWSSHPRSTPPSHYHPICPLCPYKAADIAAPNSINRVGRRASTRL